MPFKSISLLCLLAGAVVAAQASHLNAGWGWFGELAGACWVGRFPDGRTLHTHCYTRQFGHFMRGSAALNVERDGRTHILFEGDSVFTWDEAAGRIVYWTWGSDGSHRQLNAHLVDDELVFAVPSTADPRRTAHRSVWRRIDDDSFEVRRERPVDGDWMVELTVTYHRGPIGVTPR